MCFLDTVSFELVRAGVDRSGAVQQNHLALARDERYDARHYQVQGVWWDGDGPDVDLRFARRCHQVKRGPLIPPST